MARNRPVDKKLLEKLRDPLFLAALDAAKASKRVRRRSPVVRKTNKN
jgi:hypothetical protein